MANFEDIKVGDTVFINQRVHYGFNSNRYFYIPVKVIKVTKTQFTCDNNKRYQKDYGHEIGGGSYLDRAHAGSEKVIDETDLMEEFNKQLKVISKTTNLIYNLDRKRNSINPEMDQKLLQEFNDLAEKLLLKIN